MIDYKPEHGSYEDKLGRAIGYLLEHKIYRGRANCLHIYRNSEGKRTTPSFQPFKHRADGLPF